MSKVAQLISARLGFRLLSEFKSSPLLPCSRIPPRKNHISIADPEEGNNAEPQWRFLMLSTHSKNICGLTDKVLLVRYDM